MEERLMLTASPKWLYRSLHNMIPTLHVPVRITAKTDDTVICLFVCFSVVCCVLFVNFLTVSCREERRSTANTCESTDPDTQVGAVMYRNEIRRMSLFIFKTSVSLQIQSVSYNIPNHIIILYSGVNY
jgi:hypothetical protein